MSIENAFKAVIDENRSKYPDFGTILTEAEKNNDKYFFLIDAEDESFISTGNYPKDGITQKVNIILIARSGYDEDELIDEKLRNTASELMKIFKNNKKLVSNENPEGFLQTCSISKNTKGSNVYFGSKVRIRALEYDCKFFG